MCHGRPRYVKQSFSAKYSFIHRFPLWISLTGQLISLCFFYLKDNRSQEKIVSVLFIMADLSFDFGSFWSLDGPKALNTGETDAFLASCSVPEPQKQLLLPEVNYWRTVNKTQTSHNNEYLKQHLCQTDDNLWSHEKQF